MSQQHQPRKHYHIHAPYPHHPPPVPAHHTHAPHPGPPPPPSSSSHHVAAQQQQQQHQQWYNAHAAAGIPPPQAQPPPPQYHHGLHIRDSRHLQQQHHHAPHPHHPQQHGHAMPAPPPPPPTHMFTSGYAGGGGIPVGVGGGAGGTSSTHNSASAMPATGSSSSASAPHFSTLAGVGGPPNVVGSGTSVITGSGGGGVIVGCSRVYDLEMVNTQHGGGAGAPSMLAIGGARGAAYDAYSHSSLYTQPPTSSSQRHHHQQQQQQQLHHHHQQQQQQQHHYQQQQHQQHYYHHQRLQQQQHQQQQQHSQHMPPMITNIKSEPVEQLTITPSIQMEEIIIKPEPLDEMPYHKNAPQIENNATFTMNEERKQHQQQQQQQLHHQQRVQQAVQEQKHHPHLHHQLQHQQQQQQEQQQRHHHHQQQQQLHHQQQQQQQQQQHQQSQGQYQPQQHHRHPPHHHQQLSQQVQHQRPPVYQNENVSQQQRQEPQTSLQQQQQQQKPPTSAAVTVNTENSKIPAPPTPASASTSAAAATAVSMAEEKPLPISLANIKSEPKPLNFPRRKLQTERSSTLPICQRCKQVFLKRQNYVQHVALSTCSIVEYDFKCSICPMSFMSNEELQAHEQLHRSNRYFCQKYCGKYYETIDECEHHEFGQHEYDMFKCNICCVSFTKRDQLFSHLVDHRQQPRYDCCICRLCFQDLLELEDHYVGNPDFCGKFYDKEEFKNLKCFAKTNKHSATQPTTTNRTENLTSFLIKDITSMKTTDTSKPRLSSKHQHLTSALHSAHSSSSPTTSAAADNYDDIPDFAAPQVEIKTEIKVEPDFYPPMDQSDFGFDNDYSSNSQEFTTNSNQNLTFLQDYHDNASSSTNSSFSFNLQRTNTPTKKSSRNSEAIQDEDAYCCVPKCGVRKFTSPTLNFFPFPRDEKYLMQWLHNLKMSYDPNVNYGVYRVCSLHFPKRCIARYSLSYWAVPTFNLGHDDVGNLYQNRESSGGFPSGEMARCYMPGCLSQRGETNVKFHSFPRDLKTLIKWCQNSRLPIHSKENRFFCSRHFEEKCFGKFRLKPWAIPTLRLGTVYGKIHDNPNIYQEEKKCFLPFCRRSRSYDCNLSLYRFPRDETLLRRWCYNLRLDPEMYRGKNHKICSSHFVKEALGLRKLNPGAVPTMNLGHNDTFDIYENELYTPPPPLPSSNSSQASTSSKAKKFAELLKQQQEMSGSSTALYDDVFLNSMATKISSLGGGAAQSNALDLGDVCLVPTCKRTRHTDNITLHTVPKRPEQLKKWCHNLKMDLEKLHKSVRICSAHFESYCIGGCMRPFAVPTLELGHDDPNIYRNPDVIKKLNIRETCCVPTCKRNRDRDHANLHRFPTHPELLQKWCENLQKPVPDGTKLFNDAVCEVHFEDRCLRNKRLEKWAIPTINLGYDDITHQLPSEEEVAEHWTKPFAPNNGDEQGECCVSTCRRNPQIDDIKLYRPPEDAEQLLKWAHNLQVDAGQLPLLKICNLHFESHCIGKRLLNWAMPTLNLASKVEHLFENPPPTQVVYKKKEKSERIGGSKHELIKWSPRCCLPHCRKTRIHDNVQLFRFPYANRQTLAKWCHNIQLPLVGSSHRRICSTHFEPSVLTKRCPMNFAVPTLNLNNHPGYKIYQNPARLKQPRIGGTQRQCVVETCRKTKVDGVVLFRFPNSRMLMQKWRHNIKNMPKGKLTTLMRVCSDHFEPHSVGGRRISPGAIPTLKLGHDSDDLYPNEKRSYFELEKCIVKGCDSRKGEDMRLYRFPRDDEELLAKWCHNLKMNPMDCVGVRICHKHFETECQGPKLLYKWAIPTLELGHNKDDDEEELEIIQNPPPDQRSGEFIYKCCVPNCGKTRKYDDAQMNSFPKHLKLFRKWKHNLKLDFLDFKEREKYKICNDHFEPICVGKTRLNFGAIPTVNLGHDETEDLYKINPDRIRPNLFIKKRDIERMERQQLRLEERRERQQERDDNMDMDEEDEAAGDELLDPLSTPAECCVEECHGPKSLMREPYDLPESEELRQLWCQRINEGREEKLPMESKLCGLHFQEIFRKLKDKMDLLKDQEKEDVKADYANLVMAYQKSEMSLLINGFQCRVEGCNSSILKSELRLFYFPYGKEIAKKWSHNTGIIPDEHRRYMNKVCSLHFETYCITETQRLRPWAIPTLQLKSSTEKIYKNPDLTRLDRRMIGPQIIKCAVENCENSQEKDMSRVKLFNFPSDDDMLKKWCANLKMSRHLTPLYKICSKHFEKQCFGSLRIRSWAVPTLNLGHSETPEFYNRTTIKKEVYDDDATSASNEAALKQVKIKKSLDIIKCFVPTCRRSRLKHGVRFYSLPSHEKMRRKWLHNLQVPSNKAAKLQNLKVCNLHFHKRCLDGKTLKPWAMPTKHLGHAEPIFDNPRRLQNPLMLKKCILPHCKNHQVSHDDTRTFVFPKVPEYLEKWAENLKLDVGQCKGRLCSEHFEEEVIGEKKLKNGAVPTINLGHDENPLPYDNKELLKKIQMKSMATGEDGKTNGDADGMLQDGGGNEMELIDEEEEDEDEDEDEVEFEDDDFEYGYLVDNNDDDDADYEMDEYDEMDDSDYDDEEKDKSEEKDEENEEEEEEEEIDLSKIRLRGTSQPWTSLNLKEVRVTLVPLTPEDILDMSSRSSFSRDQRSITPASSFRDLRAETPASFNGAAGMNSSEYIDENSSTSTTITTATSNNITTTALRTDRKINNIAPRCCLKYCGREKTPDQHLTTYGFPKDPQLLQKWCDNLGLQPEECIGRVCIDHFELRVIGTRRLKPGAVPTLKLGPSRVAQHNNDEISKIKSFLGDQETKSIGAGDSEQILTPPPPYGTPKPGRQSVFRLCCLKHCRRKKLTAEMAPGDEPPKLYRFPVKHPELLKKWCANLDIPEDTENLAKLRLCSNHFEPYLMRKDGLLKPKSIPTLDLNETQTPPVFKVKQRRDKHILITNKPQCSLEHCRRKEDQDTFIINFPQHDKNLQRKWCFNLKLGRKKLRYLQIKLCNRHFEPCAFYKDRHVRSGAVPTVDLGHEGRIIRNAPKIRRQIRGLGLKEMCCVNQCQQREEEVKLFPFPKNFELRHTWCNNLQIDMSQALNGHYKVCAEHFTKESFADDSCKDLTIDAVPTLKLAEATAVKEEIKEDEVNVEANQPTGTPCEKSKENVNPTIPCCYLPHCKRQEDPENGTFLVDFPQNTPNTLKKWCLNLKLSQKLKDFGEFKICNHHFEERAFKEDMQIKRGILPTIDLGHNDRIIKNISRREHKCCVSNCKNVEKYKRYSFPKDKELRQIWFRKLRIKRNEIVQRPLKVCRQHFRDSCFVEGTDQLKEDAVPYLKRNVKRKSANKEEGEGEQVVKLSGTNDKKEEEEICADKTQTSDERKSPPSGSGDSKPHCCLAHCGVQEDPITNTFLIGFPQRGSNMRRKWCINLRFGRSAAKHDDNLKICNHHFESYAFYKQKYLKAGAVPTLNLGHNERIIKNDAKLRRKIRLEPKDVCCISSCENRDSPKQLFPFPKNSELRRIWSNNLQIPLRQALSNHYKLCEKHFTVDSFELGTNILKINAVPSVNLGIKEEDTQKVLIKIENEDDSGKCVVESCQKSSSVDKVKLFQLPKSKELLKKWLHNLNLPHDIDLETTRICQRHFEKACLRQGNLHENAIPTQCLKAKSWFYQNDDELFEEICHECCVSNCNYRENNSGEDTTIEQQRGEVEDGDDRKMFKFPKQKEDIDKWLFNLKLNCEDKELKNLRVCSNHFETRCIDKQQNLLMGSVPTLNLGHSDIENIHNNDIQKCCIINCSYWLNYQCFKLAEGGGVAEEEEEQFKAKCLQVLKSNIENNDVEYMCCVHFISYYGDLNCEDIPRLRQLYENLKNLTELQCFRCSVPQCKTGFNLNIQLFKFPKDESLLQKWLHNSSVEFPAAERSKYRICALHFENRCFSEKKLHRWSLPTLALPYNLSLYVNPPEALPSHHENLKHCCVASCNTDVGPFFKFPTKTLEIRKWIHNLNLGPQQCTLNLRVCYQHFESYCLTHNEEGEIVKLKCWAVPTLNLSHNNSPDLYNNPQHKVDMFVCCICQELQNKAESLHLFRFPSRLSVFLKWLHNLKIPRNQYRPSMRICIRHFENECFHAKLKILRKDSVPTLGVKCPKQELFRNPKRNFRRKCCVAVCEGPWSHLYTFPKEKILLKKWYFNLKIKQNDVDERKMLKICEKHFENKCLNAFGALRSTAVPTLNLGHSTRIFKNPRQMEKSKTKMIAKNTKKGRDFRKKIQEEQKAIEGVVKKVQQLRQPKKNEDISAKELRNKKKEENLEETEILNKSTKVKTKLNQENLLDDDDKPLVNFIKEKRQQEKSGTPTILENTKKRKIAKKFLPVKPEPENKPLFEIITSDMELERSTPSTSFALTSLPKLHAIKQEAFLGFEIREVDKRAARKGATALRCECSYPECKQTKAQIYRWPEIENLKKLCFKSMCTKIQPNEELQFCDEHFYRLYKQFEEYINELSSNPGDHQQELQALIKTYKELSSRCKFLGKRCMVPQCTTDLYTASQTNNDIKLHHFPSQVQTIARRWCHNFGMDYDQLDKVKMHYYKVCSRHFEDYCYNARSIYSWAMPTLNLPQGTDIYENTPEDKCASAKKSVVSARHECSYPECKQPKAGLYKCPEIANLKKLWLDSMPNQNKPTAIEEVYFCDEHFYKFYKQFEDHINEMIGNPGEHQKELQALLKTYKEISARCKFVFKRCMVPQCTTDLCTVPQTSNDIRLHHFPFSSQGLARKWCHNFAMDYDQLEKSKLHYYKVCSRHFESYCYNARSIYSWAIPTLNLPRVKDIYENSPEDKCAYQGQCCVESCVNSKGLQTITRTRLFKFPSDPEKLNKWLENVKCENFQADETKICGLHFRYKFITKQKKLTDDAIPTLKLGSTFFDNDEEDLLTSTNVFVKEELPDYDEQQIEDNANAFGWSDHDYCFETSKETNNIAIKQELIEDQYGLEQEHQQHSQDQSQLFASQTIKEEIIEIDETDHQNYDNYYQPPDPTENETENQPEPKTSFPSLVISEVKSHIYLCCVNKCTNTSETRGIKLYTEFPSDSEIFIKWCFNLKIDPRNYKENQYAICSEHFEAICFSDGDLKLHSWAVPTLNLNLPDNSFIHHNDPPSEQCLVYGCIQPLMPLYKFPLRLDLCQKWFVNLKLDFNQYRVDNYRICRRHFTPACFDVNYVLKSEAIPTLCLGHSDQIQHHSEFGEHVHQPSIEEVRGNNNNNPPLPDFIPGLLIGVGAPAAENSRGSSSQGSLVRHLISPNDLEDHDSSYYEDFEECYGQDE
ncbi:uncharacterized protein LOC101901640 [Musca domestica]|uniref:Uncharacterized protein LOC101901640 n=1 Tax=Musca domestica TaxID=7370 RepID=A0A9J7CWV7_MUSDO|nr:uncharacterized protein LOC101901640 [Musca domestica]